MVTTSDLEKLNVINEKSEKNVHYSSNFIPDSISWMLPPERSNQRDEDSPVSKLRNKRLHFLFERQNEVDEYENCNETDIKVTDTTGSTSVDYPTTQLKPHELTNKLEMRLIESSFFGSDSAENNHSESSFHINKNIGNTISSSEFLNEKSFHSIVSVNLVLPWSREMDVENSSMADYARIARDTTLFTKPKLRSDSPVVSSMPNSNPRKHSLSNSPITRSTKKFKSRSQYDLVFPNFEL